MKFFNFYRTRRHPIVLAGGGGHALSLLEAAAGIYRIAGYTSPEPSAGMPLEWLGDDAMAPILKKDNIFHIAFVYAVLPVMDKRRALIEAYENIGADFATIIASTAVVTLNATIAEGCAILNGAIVNRAKLGRHVIVNTGAIVEHDCHIGSNTFIGPGAVLGGGVKAGRDCFIGLGAKIKNGVTIAPGVTVGMGAVVTRDLNEPGIYHGNPLKFHPLRR